MLFEICLLHPNQVTGHWMGTMPWFATDSIWCIELHLPNLRWNPFLKCKRWGCFSTVVSNLQIHLASQNGAKSSLADSLMFKTWASVPFCLGHTPYLANFLCYQSQVYCGSAGSCTSNQVTPFSEADSITCKQEIAARKNSNSEKWRTQFTPEKTAPLEESQNSDNTISTCKVLARLKLEQLSHIYMYNWLYIHMIILVNNHIQTCSSSRISRDFSCHLTAWLLAADKVSYEESGEC